MAVTQYIGARYVPVFADPAEWSNTKQYEPLTIVLHEGNSYTSRQFVPIGVDIDNTDFWAETGNYNAQVEAYRQEVLTFDQKINKRVACFETVSDMTNGQLQAGMICHTNGFHASGDNGAAYYSIVEEAIPNGIDIIQCGSLFARLVYSEVMTPEMFSARGDGITDDSVPMQFAINSGKTILLSDKVYLIHNTLTISNPIIIKGTHSDRLKTNRKQLLYTSDSILFNITAAGVVFECVNFSGNNKGVATLINVENKYRLTLNCCGFFNCEYALKTNRAWNIGINNCVFEFCSTCLDLNSINTSISIVGCNFYSSDVGIYSHNELDYSALFACGFDSCKTGIILENSYANNLTLVSCGFEFNEICIYAKGNSNCTVIQPTIVNGDTSSETYTGLGKIVVIGGSTASTLTPNKSDVIYIGVAPTNNVNTLVKTFATNTVNMQTLKNVKSFDYVRSVVVNEHFTISYDTSTQFDVCIDCCTTEYPETCHITKQGTIIAKTQITPTTFTMTIDRTNNKVIITMIKGGTIHVHGWFKDGGNITH